jgi:hypothetical protein
MGGGGSSSQQTSSQNISQTQLPPWVNQAAQQNYALAQNIAERPLTQYQGQQVADIGPQTQQAWNLAATSGGAGADQYNAAQAGYLGTLASTPQQIQAAQGTLSQGSLAAPTVAQQAALAAPTVAQQAQLSTLNGMNLQGYMNPYVQSVINTTLPIMNQSLANQQNALQNQANQSNAFGGSRQAIQQGVTGAQGALSEAQMAAGLNQANYQQAQQAGEFDVGQANQMGEFNAGQTNQVGMYNQGQANQANQFNAGQSNQVGMYNQGQANQMSQFNTGQANNMSQFNAGAQNTAAYQNQMAGLQQETLNNAAAGGMGALGTQAQTNQRQQFLEESTAGAQEQQQAQNQIAANMGQFNQANAYPGQQLGVLQSALGMTPYGSTTMGSSTGQSETQTNPGIGGAVMGGLESLGGMFGSGGAFGAGGAGAALFASDKALKTDITKTGVHPPTGLPIYSYRYKGDPKSYPKVSGPMAEDVMQVAPHAVKTIGVHPPTGQAMHGVDMGALNAVGAPGGMPGGGPSITKTKLTAVPSIRPQGMPKMGGAAPVPGALAPPAPMGVTGAMGANLRPPKMRRPTGMPQMRGAMAGGGRG